MQLLKEHNMKDDFMGNSRLLISTDLKNHSSCIINSDFYLSLSSIVKDICDWENKHSLNEILNKNIRNKRIENPIRNCLLFYTTVQRNFPIESTDHHRSFSSDVLV